MLAEGGAGIAHRTVRAARGGGVAPGATAALTRWALDGIGFHRLELPHAPADEASCRVAARAGLTLEGARCSACLRQDGRHDMHLHARRAYGATERRPRTRARRASGRRLRHGRRR